MTRLVNVDKWLAKCAVAHIRARLARTCTPRRAIVQKALEAVDVGSVLLGVVIDDALDVKIGRVVLPRPLHEDEVLHP